MLSLLSPAKLNLFLEVLGKRTDGYHDIESVFVAVDLADTMRAAPLAAGRVTVRCDRPDVPVDERNLAVKAAQLLRRECGVRDGVAFELEKRIPMGAGLGGGSSNAATALLLANELWGTGLSPDELAELGLRVGSDVPFFLHGGVCLCRGRGEVVAFLPDFPPEVGLGVALSGIFSDTAAAYRGLALPEPGGARRVDDFVQALASGDAEAMAAAAFNRFEATVFAAFPELDGIRESLGRELARPIRMSGSGSGLWFFTGRNEELSATEGRAQVLSVRALPARERAGRLSGSE